MRKKLAEKKTKVAGLAERLSERSAQPESPTTSEYEHGSLFQVDVQLIKPNPHQPRQYFDPGRLAELADSIRNKGVIQPIVIRRDEKGDVYLVAGDRRLRAAKMAGLKQVPAVVTTHDPMSIALIENLQREDLSPLEESEAMARIITEQDFSQEELGLFLGKSKATISETLSLNRLPEVIKKEVRRVEHSVPKRVLIQIARQKTPERMTVLFRRLQKQHEKACEIGVKERPKKKVRTMAAIVVSKAAELIHGIERLDLGTTEDREKMELRSELERLKAAIERLMA